MSDFDRQVAESFERVFPVPVVTVDWNDVLDRAEAGARRRARPSAQWRMVAIAVVILVGALLVSPAFGIGGRLLDLIRDSSGPREVQTPVWSPDGRAIAFVSRRDGDSEIYVMWADGSGQQNVSRHPGNDSAPVWSPEGLKIAFVGHHDGNSLIYVMNSDGSVLGPVSRGPASVGYPAWSPNGQRIAYVGGCCGRGASPGYLYVVDKDGSGLRRLTQDHPQAEVAPTWTPDGRTIRFGRYLVNADGSGQRKLPGRIPPAGAWSPDGRRIAFVRVCRDPGRCAIGTNGIYVMNADGSGLRMLVRSAARSAPVWSPDGRRLAFRRTRDGNPEIYVVNAEGSGLRRVTRHPANERWFAWSPDGRRLTFVRNRDVYVVHADGSGERRLTKNG